MTSEQINNQKSKIQNPLVVGLLGGIGSGKSEVSRLLTGAGARVISGDGLAHEALRDPTVREAVVRRWGTDIVNEEGQIERRRLGAIVFRDAAQLKELEALTHPWIKRRIEEELAALRLQTPALIVLDAAVMLEAGWHDVCDELVFVDTPRERRLERIRAQRGWTEKEVQAREDLQWPLAEKAARAQHIVDNSGSPQALASQVEALLHTWGVPKPPGTSDRSPY